jgi:hypothetical protein
MRIWPSRRCLIVWSAVIIVPLGGIALLRLNEVVQQKRAEQVIRDFQKLVTGPATQKAAEDFYMRNRRYEQKSGLYLAPSRPWFLPHLQDGECIEPYWTQADAGVVSLAVGGAERWLSRAIGARCWWVLVLAGPPNGANINAQLRIFTVLEPPKEPITYQGSMVITVSRVGRLSPQVLPGCEVLKPHGNEYRVWFAKNGMLPEIDFSEDSTAAERTRLTTVNTACLGRTGANCTGFKEIMPLAAEDGEAQNREYREAIDRLKAQRPECKWLR